MWRFDESCSCEGWTSAASDWPVASLFSLLHFLVQAPLPTPFPAQINALSAIPRSFFYELWRTGLCKLWTKITLCIKCNKVKLYFIKNPSSLAFLWTPLVISSPLSLRLAWKMTSCSHQDIQRFEMLGFIFLTLLRNNWWKIYMWSVQHHDLTYIYIMEWLLRLR